MNYDSVEKMMLEKLRKDLPEHLTYHSVHHIIDVRDAAIALAEQEGIAGEEMVVLKTAALFHDSGFIFGAKGHEEKSCEIARQYLPEYGYDAPQIEQICGMIMATKLPQSPKNRLEEILADADLDYLGRDDFFSIGNGLYEELAIIGIINNEDDWNRLQLKFLESHHYFTATAIKNRQKGKECHVQQIKEKLNH